MATMVAEPVFIDTNVLIYAKQSLSPWHASAVAKLQDHAAAGHPLWISRQTLREYLSAMSRPGALTTPVPMSALIADVRSFESQFLVAEDGPGVTAHLLSLLSTVACGGKQVHDANLVATMMAVGIPKLLTHNVADFNRFAAWITVVSLVP